MKYFGQKTMRQAVLATMAGWLVSLWVAQAAETIPFRAWFNVTNVVFISTNTANRIEVRVGGTGESSDLGNSTCVSDNQYGDLATGKVTADYLITVANGDQLALHFDGQSVPDPASPQTKLTFTAAGRIVAGTGRFSGISGDVTAKGWSELRNLETGEGIGYLEIRGEVPKSLATLVVTNTDDSGPGSLRQAILDANDTPEIETVAFDIPAAAQYPIQPFTSLPAITAPIQIDGSTQPGYAGKPLIELNGELVESANRWGVQLNGGRSVLRALAINGFSVQVRIEGRGTNIVESCFVGTDLSGAGSGAVDLSRGIGIYGMSLLSTTCNQIGGRSPGSGNVISGNAAAGISLSGSSSNVVEGNFIGTDLTGSQPLGNGVALQNGSGVVIKSNFGDDRRSVGNRIGGLEPGAGNVLSANGGCGVLIYDGPINDVLGNWIGVDVTGTNALGNGLAGVCLDGGAPSTITGTRIAQNVIAANGFNGVFLRYAGARQTTVQGNWIGTDRSGTLDLGHGQFGVAMLEGTSQNLIGGINVGEGNVIAFNQLGGVSIGAGRVGGFEPPVNSQRGTVRGNSIYANDGLGIEIEIDPFALQGVSANDLGDVDSGPNGTQNFPVIISAEAVGAELLIRGTLNSRSASEFDLDFYSSTACDPSGQGESERYLGSSRVATDSDGELSFALALPVAVPVGQVVTATATDVSGNTSEFSACVSVITGNPPPELTLSQGSDGRLLLDWSSAATGYKLESTENLSAPNWQAVPDVVGHVHPILPDLQRFYRLHR